MKIRVSLLMLFFFLFLAGGYVQDFNNDQVIAEARTQLIALSSETGELKKFCQEKNITGEFVINITLQGKGKVLTVFMVSRKDSFFIPNDLMFPPAPLTRKLKRTLN
jgi:hypothetical protein